MNGNTMEEEEGEEHKMGGKIICSAAEESHI